MERTEMSERNFYRLIHSIRSVGFVVNSKNGHYEIERNNKLYNDISSLLTFSEEESHILQEAIYSIESTSKTKDDLINKLAALYDNERIPYSFIGKMNSQKVKPLLEGIRKKLQVKLAGYYSGNSGTVSDRIIEPFAFTHNYDAVWAFEPETSTNKLFKTSRAQKVVLLDINQKYLSEHNAAYVDCFRMSDMKQIKASFEMDLMAFNLLTEEFPLSSKLVSSISEGKYKFAGDVAKWEGIGRFILGLPSHIQNIEPLGLRTYVKSQVDFFYQNLLTLPKDGSKV